LEILTQKGHHPSRDWLSFVKSSHAKSKIRHWINEQEREESEGNGEKAAGKRSAALRAQLKKVPEPDLLNLFRTTAIEDRRPVCSGRIREILGAADLGARAGREREEEESETADAAPTIVKTVKRMLGFGEAPLIVKGYDDLLVYRAKCCNPSPAMKLSGTSRAAAASLCTRGCVPTCRI